jgi:hypothetical protein
MPSEDSNLNNSKTDFSNSNTTMQSDDNPLPIEHSHTFSDQLNNLNQNPLEVQTNNSFENNPEQDLSSDDLPSYNMDNNNEKDVKEIENKDDVNIGQNQFEQNMESDSKDLIALMRVVSGDTIEADSLSKIPRAIAKIVPKVIERLVSEYEYLYKRQAELEKKISFLSGQRDSQKEVFLEALNSDQYSEDKMSLMTPESRNIIRDYLSFRRRVNGLEEKIEKVREEIKAAQEYVDDYGLKTKVRPSLSPEYDDLVESIDRSLGRISENVRVNLFRQISSALSSGQSDTLPQDLLELIHKLVIERLESLLRPYEELSAKYVSGDLTHEEFTDLLRKNALLTLLREKVIEDIIREYENNNLASPIIPMRLRLATERMVADAKNFARIMSMDTSIKIINDDEGATGQAYSMSESSDDKVI